MKQYTWNLIVRDADDFNPSFTTPSDVTRWLQTRPEFKQPREAVMVLMVDTRNRLRSFEHISSGTLNGSLVHPCDVYRAALHEPNCAAVILVHSHPSGNPRPSREDLELTRRLREAGHILGVDMLDHIIITPVGNTYSLKTHNLLDP